MLTPPRTLQAPAGPDGRPPQGGAPVLDPAALAGLRDLDPTGKNRLLERVLTAFKTSTARLVPQLQDAHRNGDAQGIRHVAHTLKSSSASVGGARLSSICADLEARIRLEQGGDVTPQVQALVDETGQLLIALERLNEAGR
jgi:HPt (histidine-containing phosphotransfer) domain-containing protein